MDLENFPDQVLLTEILPNIPLRDLLNLCSANMRFNNLCKEELLWMIKFRKEYSSMIKPDYITWKELYMGVTNGNIKNINVYINGNIIGNVYLYLDKLDYNINNYDKIINLIPIKRRKSNISIIYTDNNFLPILFQSNSQKEIKILSTNVYDIQYVIVLNADIILFPKCESVLDIPKMRFIIVNYFMVKRSFYGYIWPNGNFSIVNNSVRSPDIKIRLLGKSCRYMRKNDLLNLIMMIPHEYVIFELGKLYPGHIIDVYLMILTHYSRSKICDFIYNYLNQTGGLIKI